LPGFVFSSDRESLPRDAHRILLTGVLICRKVA